LESCFLQDFELSMNRASRSSIFDRTEAKKRTPLPKVDPLGESCHSQRYITLRNFYAILRILMTTQC